LAAALKTNTATFWTSMTSTHTPTSRPVQHPSASTALWAHLLRKDVSALAPSSSTNPIPSGSYVPIAPIDKNGTSMRILLLDASNNLEKFSARVDKLITGLGETKTEIVAVHRMFRDENEKLANDLVDVGEH
jgi:hypothetical protein